MDLFGSLYDWQFKSPTPRACKAIIGGCSLPAGKVLGGGSSINWFFFVRGNKRDYDGWESEFGATGWNYETVLKYFKRWEKNENPGFVKYQNGRYHSATGPIKVDSLGDFTEFQSLSLDAAAEKGYKFINDINADNATGYVQLQGTLFKGIRSSTVRAYLIPAMNRSNLHVIKHAFVKKILINDQNVAYGVTFNYKGKEMKAFSQKEVIISAGTIMSSNILMRSGVGPRNDLQKHKISVKSDLPVGNNNLIDHASMSLFFKLNPSKTTPTKTIDDFYNYAIHKTGPLTLNPQLSAFLNTLNDSPYPDIQASYDFYPVNSTGLRKFLNQLNYKEFFKTALLDVNSFYDVATIRIRLIQPVSRGYVKLDSKSSFHTPKVQVNYFGVEKDIETMLRGVKLQLSLLETKAYRKAGVEFIHIPIEECDRFAFLSDAYLKCYIEYTSVMGGHHCCTSRMGSDSDPKAVVDPFLRVRGIKRLRQIDCGV